MRTVRCLLRFATLSLVALLLAGGLALAAPVTFVLEYSGAPTNTARATGWITFEETLLPNPGDIKFDLPSPVVLDLQLTVTGASTGNGTYALDDFTGVRWNTNGATLDLTTELIGQSTPESPWGTTYDGDSGDFNLFIDGGEPAPRGSYGPVAARAAAGPSQLPPNGENFFTLGVDGGGNEAIVLVSIAPGAVPALGGWGAAVLAAVLLAATLLAYRRRTAGMGA
jgi:hypothetical protein